MLATAAVTQHVRFIVTSRHSTHLLWVKQGAARRVPVLDATPPYGAITAQRTSASSAGAVDHLRRSRTRVRGIDAVVITRAHHFSRTPCLCALPGRIAWAHWLGALAGRIGSA